MSHNNDKLGEMMRDHLLQHAVMLRYYFVFMQHHKMLRITCPCVKYNMIVLSMRMCTVTALTRINITEISIYCHPVTV